MFRSYLEKAEKTILHINENYPRRLLLHGDLHHENILKNGAGEYKVIDPKGVVGNSVFDLSRFILDEFRDDLTSEPKSAVIDFVKSVGNGVKIPCDTLLQCLFVGCATRQVDILNIERFLAFAAQYWAAFLCC